MERCVFRPCLDALVMWNLPSLFSSLPWEKFSVTLHLETSWPELSSSWQHHRLPLVGGPSSSFSWKHIWLFWTILAGSFGKCLENLEGEWDPQSTHHCQNPTWAARSTDRVLLLDGQAGCPFRISFWCGHCSIEDNARGREERDRTRHQASPSCSDEGSSERRREWRHWFYEIKDWGR